MNFLPYGMLAEEVDAGDHFHVRSLHDPVRNLFRVGRHLLRSSNHRLRDHDPLRSGGK
jgi:hypothetical protein